ncbi:MAG: RNA polymerase Rpb4 [Candidatus Hecatellales archaeon]|nr:MAG: RNA polymerase Rpb4 [Candidatus Hecatellales archaeon]
MPVKIVESKPIPVAKVKEILSSLDRELNQFQRRTLEYSQLFSKLDGKAAEELVERLVKEFELEVGEAVQIVNCMPETIEELRVFFPRYKMVATEKLEAILKVLDEYRSKQG